MEARITNTRGFKALARDAKGRSRGPTTRLLKRLDIVGTHVVQFDMIHNDEEIRCLWLCKVDDSDKPLEVWMDNSVKAFNRHTGLASKADDAQGEE